jgi:regulatory protein
VSEEQEALGLALQALGQKERSVAELGSWLRQRGVAGEQADEVVAHLLETEVLDDARFASRYAEDKRELSGWGGERIRAALLERGVAPADVEAALGGEGAEAELDRAVSLLRARGAPLEDERDRSRALGLLARRGYEAETAYEAIRRARAG